MVSPSSIQSEPVTILHSSCNHQATCQENDEQRRQSWEE